MPATTVRVTREGGLQRVVMENQALRTVILPELGGKIASLVSLKSGREFFLQHPDRPFRRARYGDPFGDYDISGFDECLPTVSACRYPEPPFAGVPLPDHGEVWSLPWETEIQGEELALEVAGIGLPYILRRRMRLSGSTLELDYEISNTSAQPFKYLWSAHPLLEIEPGAEIILPPGVSEMLVDFSVAGRLPVGKTKPWPGDSSQQSPALNMIFGREQKSADKLFTPRLVEGYCGLRIPSTAESIFFRFDPQRIPFVGLWICQGGFPVDGPPEFTVALEPCSGRPDSLVSAIAKCDCMELGPHASQRWSLGIEIQAAS